MPELDHFQRLGLPRRFSLAAEEFERNYLARSRAVHPDLAGESASEESSRLNEAYATLRDPFRRAEYLLQLLGGPGAKEVSQAPPEFLMEMMELRERVGEAKDNAAMRENMERELTTNRDQMVQAAGHGLDLPAPNLHAIRMGLNAAKYVSGLLRDFEER